MTLLMVFALIAGAGTALSPCVLPVLPAVLAAGATGGRRRPLGIVTGLALSFTIATVALVYVIEALGLPDGLVRDLAIAVLIAFGLSLLLPPLGDRIEAAISRLVPAPARPGGEGFGSGLLVGASLGLIYAPCAGPILAGVITVSASQEFTAGKLAVALSYAIGSAIVLYALILGGHSQALLPGEEGVPGTRIRSRSGPRPHAARRRADPGCRRRRGRIRRRGEGHSPAALPPRGPL